MSIATKCTCGHSMNGYCQERIKECMNLIRPTTLQNWKINKGFEEGYRYAIERLQRHSS